MKTGRAQDPGPQILVTGSQSRQAALTSLIGGLQSTTQLVQKGKSYRPPVNTQEESDSRAGCPSVTKGGWKENHLKPPSSQQEPCLCLLCTHRDALPHDAALLHAPRTSKLLHVLAKVALSTLRPQAGLALAASRPAPASSCCCSVGSQLHR